MRFFIIVFCVLLEASAVNSQSPRVRFSQVPPAATAPAQGFGAPQGLSAPPIQIPSGQPAVPGISGQPVLGPGASLGVPVDPYSPGAQGYAPGYPPPGYGQPQMGYQPYQPQLSYPPPNYPPPSYGVPNYGQQNYPPPSYGQPSYGQQNYNTGQPQGIFGNSYSPYANTNDWLNQFENGRYMRVVQEVHYRHTWLEGSESAEVDINDAEIGFTLNWPNFLGSGEPLQLSPTFIFHFWDGPQPPSLADLPSRAYSAFLASAWSTPTNQNFGGEIVSSVGVYTDFNTFTTKSLRVKGSGLGWVRLTPNMTAKFGVSYLNRLDVKLFPAGGIFWKPNDRWDLELFFPSPKISYKLQQMGNTELTSYVTAGYGGDSWTIQRTAGFSDQIDLIDIRVLAGIEFVGFRGLRGFFEAGYAFDRELLYRTTPEQSIRLSDSAILRAGFLF